MLSGFTFREKPVNDSMHKAIVPRHCKITLTGCRWTSRCKAAMGKDGLQMNTCSHIILGTKVNVRETPWSVKENSFSSSTMVEQKKKNKPAYEAQESAVKWQFVILLVSLREQLWKRLPVPELFNGQWQNALNPANKEPQALVRQIANWY